MCVCEREMGRGVCVRWEGVCVVCMCALCVMGRGMCEYVCVLCACVMGRGVCV